MVACLREAILLGATGFQWTGRIDLSQASWLASRCRRLRSAIDSDGSISGRGERPESRKCRRVWVPP